MSAATVTVQDYKGKTAVARVNGVTTIANAKKVADFLKGHSDAKVVAYGISLDYSGDDTSSGKYDRVLQGLKFSFEDQNGKTRYFTIPAPRDEDVNDDQEPESDVAEDVKDLLNSVGLKIATYNGGGLNSRLPSKESRAKVMTGI
jgi:hypothetical protein